MPVYEYRCARSEHRFEKLGSFSANQEEVTCPACQRGGGERLVSLFTSFSRQDVGIGQGGGGCCGGGGGCACRP